MQKKAKRPKSASSVSLAPSWLETSWVEEDQQAWLGEESLELSEKMETSEIIEDACRQLLLLPADYESGSRPNPNLSDFLLGTTGELPHITGALPLDCHCNSGVNSQ